MATADDHLFAADLATRAGELLLEVRSEFAAADRPASELKDEGDRRSHVLLMDLLCTGRPDDAVLSEEGDDSAARLTADRVWIIDPVDGTREFSEPPRSDWAVHVALVENHRPTAGAVALPGLGLTLHTGVGGIEAVPAPPAGRPRIVCSRTRPGAAADVLVDTLGGELVRMGSAGAKAMAVVRGEADIYAHTGGQYEWDSCAPAAVATAAGLHASRLDGSPLRYNGADPYLPDLLICRPELTESALDALRSL